MNSAALRTKDQPKKAAPVSTYRPSREQWDALLAQFHYFNEVLFDGTLPEVMLNMSRHARSNGFFAPDRWRRGAGATGPEGKDESTHEISLNPDQLGREPRAVAGTLVHEMCHLWQAVHGKQASRGYHDKEWGTKMEMVGLMPSSTAAPGGKRTGKRVSHYVIEGGPFALAWKNMPESMQLPWRSGMSIAAEAGVEQKKQKDPSKLKYTCSGCKTNVWGKRGLSISCVDCGCDFETEDA
jgi:predicted SprT family Zn-dependent metalloprotease